MTPVKPLTVAESQELQKQLNRWRTDEVNAQLWLFGKTSIEVYDGNGLLSRTENLTPAAGDHAYISGTTTISDEEFWAGKQWTPQQQQKFVCHGKLSDEQVWKIGDGWNIGAPVKPFSDKCVSFYKLPSVIICAAEDVASLQRWYGAGYEVRPC